MRIVAVTQARTGSTRFPRKVLMKIGQQTLLDFHLKRILKSKKIDELILATTTNPEDEAILEIGRINGISSYTGSENDVLDRFYQALQGKSADYVVRLTSDCPLIDAELIDKIIRHTIQEKLDYCSNTLQPTYPDGQDVEVFRFTALEKAWKEAELISEREHVTPYIWKNSSFMGGSLFSSANFEEGKSFDHLRMTVDEAPDLVVVEKLIHDLGENQNWLAYAVYLEKNAQIGIGNEGISRNEGYTKSLKQDKGL